MERWSNKVAVVTGASAGIGLACCKELLAKGMIVVGLARRQEVMENELKKFNLPQDKKANFHAHKCDVTNEQDIIKAFAWIDDNLNGVDALINNAGIVRNQVQIVGENNSADLRALVDTNFMAVAFCTREAFRSMKRRNVDGHVIIINSIVGHKIPMTPGMSLNLYAPTKYAATAMTEVLRQEFLLNQTNIKITSISPGAVDTEISGGKFPAGMAALQPSDIADVVSYCLQTPPHVQIHEITVKPVGERI